MEKNTAQEWADDLNERERAAFRRMCIMIHGYEDLCQDLLKENERLRNCITSLRATIHKIEKEKEN